MKKYSALRILTLVAFSCFAFAPLAFAQGGFVPLAPIPGLTQGIDPTQAGIASFLNNLYKFLIGLAAALAVIEIVWGGLEYATQDSVSEKKAGKSRIQNAVLGLVLVLLPVLVFSIINPSILNLSLSMQPLNVKVGGTDTTGSSGGGIGAAKPAVAPTTGNPQTVHGAVVDKQFSATSGEAQDFVAACKSSGGYGYYAHGIIGNLPLVGNGGSDCTASKTEQVVNGSSVSNKTTCTNYQYTAFCSQNATVTAVAVTANKLTGNSDFSQKSLAFPYGNTSTQFVNGCLNQDKGYIASTQVSLDTCPANILDLRKQNGMTSGSQCYKETVYCKISS